MSRRVSELQLEHFRAYIQGHLEDADFKLTNVAAAFRLSDRYVRRVFKAAAETPSEFLRHRRLELAARRLRDRNCDHLTILAIALECGFNDPAHFSRCFYRRYGATPRTYRKGKGAAAGIDPTGAPGRGIPAGP